MVFSPVVLSIHGFMVDKEQSRYAWGGGVVKGLILQGFASLCMSWCGYEMVMLHFKQNMSKHNVILQGMCFHQ